MNNNPLVDSVGDDFREWPRSAWGLRDRARARQEDRARDQIRAMSTEPVREFSPLQETMPVVPASVSSFRLDAPRRPRDQSARSKSVDTLLDRLGIPRGRAR
jgi:hypothetical protein